MPVACTAPSGHITGRAYRLVELYFNCASHPITAYAVLHSPQAPSDEGAGFLRSKKTEGENISLIVSLPPSKIKDFCHLPRQREASRIRIAKAFGNHQLCWWYSNTNKKQRSADRCFLFINSYNSFCYSANDLIVYRLVEPR